MNKKENDIELKEELQKDIEIPDIVNGQMEDMYDKIRSGEVRMKKIGGRSGRKRLNRGLGIASAAACLVIVLMGVFYVNPALAKDIPILGDVFGRLQTMRESSPYPDKDKTAYENIAQHAKPVATEPKEKITNVAEDKGVTISVTDAYCDGFDLYFTLSISTKDAELKTADRLDLLTFREGDPASYFAGATVDGKETFTATTLGGFKAGDGVYVALMRIPSSNVDNGGFTKDTVIEINANGIGAHRAGEESDTTLENYNKPDFSRLGFKTVRGEWNLKFKPGMDTSQNKEAKPNAEKNGFIVKKVTQTPSNMHIDFYMPKEYIERNPAVVLKDAEGNRVYEEFSSKGEETGDGQVRRLVFDQSNATQFVLQVIDKNAGPDENGNLTVLAEIPFSME